MNKLKEPINKQKIEIFKEKKIKKKVNITHNKRY